MSIKDSAENLNESFPTFSKDNLKVVQTPLSLLETALRIESVVKLSKPMESQPRRVWTTRGLENTRIGLVAGPVLILTMAV